MQWLKWTGGGAGTVDRGAAGRKSRRGIKQADRFARIRRAGGTSFRTVPSHFNHCVHALPVRSSTLRLPWKKCAKRLTVNTALITLLFCMIGVVLTSEISTYSSIYKMNPTTTSLHKGLNITNNLLTSTTAAE